MTFLFQADYESGTSAPWDAIADKDLYPGIVAGDFEVVTSHTTATAGVITPNAGPTSVAMAKIILRPNLPGKPNDRAEAQEVFPWPNFDGRTVFWSFAFLLDPDFNWDSNWTADASNKHFHPILAQVPYRNIVNNGPQFVLSPIGWQGTTAISLGIQACGGSVTPDQINGAAQHRLAVESNWTTLTAPSTAGTNQAQRHPQIIGPNCQQGQDIPFTPGVWHEIIFEVKYTADVANGHYRAHHRLRGAGPTWTKTLETPATYYTMTWRTGEPAHGTGSDDRIAIGGYVYSLPQEIMFFHDQISASTSFAEAESMFAVEAFTERELRARAFLREQIQIWRADKKTWAWIKKTPAWRAFKELGGS